MKALGPPPVTREREAERAALLLPTLRGAEAVEDRVGQRWVMMSRTGRDRLIDRRTDDRWTDDSQMRQALQAGMIGTVTVPTP